VALKVAGFKDRVFEKKREKNKDLLNKTEKFVTMVY
jgi:hypothetical protein